MKGLNRRQDEGCSSDGMHYLRRTWEYRRFFLFPAGKPRSVSLKFYGQGTRASLLFENSIAIEAVEKVCLNG